MQINDIITEGFFDNYKTVRNARLSGSNAMYKKALANMPGVSSMVQSYDNYRQTEKEHAAAYSIATKTGDAWQMQLVNLVKANGGNDLDLQTYKDSFSKFVYRAFNIIPDPRTIDSKITDQSEVAVVNYFKSVIIPNLQAREKNKVDAEEADRAYKMQQSASVDPTNNVHYGAQVKMKVTDKDPSGNDVVLTRQYKYVPSSVNGPSGPGYWIDNSGKSVHSSTQLYAALMAKYANQPVKTF
jgi:hypothetical protein